MAFKEYSKEEAKQKIEILVNDFKVNFNLIKNYNEEETKRKLIEPFFEALGWNFQHHGKNSEVHYEHNAHKTKSRRVDYIVGKGKGNFLIEAKQVSKKLDGSDKTYIVQANNYAWNKGMFCVLTDFEEFQLIKPIKPNKRKPEVCIVPEFYELGFEDYVTNFDLFWDTFSKQAVEKGSLDVLLEKEKKKRKFYTIDDDFLSDLENWRQRLANDIYKNNTELVGEDAEFLGELTQRVLDRIIFTRILEDRLIEPNSIHTVLDAENIYEKLNNYFRKLRPKYNGLIYNEHPIDTISIDDKILKDILIHICDTDRNEVVYQFDQIPVEILGSIYERFLGKTLHIHPYKKRDCVTLEKTYLTKETGIYYTPDYVVDYICENTIGKMFAKKTPQQIKDKRIIDTACGSGSFLVGAYSYLLNWYEDYYNKNPNKDENATVEIKQKIREADGSFSLITQRKLTRQTRRHILTQHIFGVDIDQQAVEVTQMSLFLKMLEENFDLQLELGYRELILPSLTDNIVCGNTLLDNTSTLLKEEKKRLKPFNWEDYFPDIVKWETTIEGDRVLADGYGFDIIIGNPPYVKEYTNKQIFHNIKSSYIGKYYQGKMDYWYLFSCQAIDLLKPKGLHSYIATNNWTTNAGASILRKKILSETTISLFLDFNNFKVFQNAGIQTMVYVLEKNKPKNKYDVEYIRVLNKEIQDTAIRSYLSNPQISIADLERYISTIDIKKINNTFTFNNSVIESICEKIYSGNVVMLTKDEVANGIHPHYDFVNKSISEKHKGNVKIGQGIFGLSHTEKKKGNFTKKELSLIKPYFTTGQIDRYRCDNKNDLWIIYTDSKFKNPKNINPYPNIKKHLDQFKKVITSDNKPYGLHRAREERFFKGEKIIATRKCPQRPRFAYSDFDCYVSATFYVIKSDRLSMKYLTTLFNSELIAFWLKYKGKMQGDNFQIDKEPLLSVPILKATESETKEIEKLHDEMVASMEDYNTSKSDYDKKSAKADVRRIDKQINQFFYEKYELTKEDIDVIEDSLPPYDFLK